MPASLRRAHHALDRAVDRLYRRQRFTSERERVEYLFALYERMQAPLAAAAAKPKTRRRRVPCGRRYDRDGPVCDQVEVCLCNRRRLRRVALFFQPLFLQICLFVFRARGIADRLHALDIGILDIRQILNPLRDIRHALHRREVMGQGARRPEKGRPEKVGSVVRGCRCFLTRCMMTFTCRC